MKLIAGLLGLLLLASSCATTIREEASGPAEDATAGVAATVEPTDKTVDELMPFIPASLMDDLVMLQSAIDYKFLESMATCMKAHGWEYPEPVLKIATTPEYESRARQLLDDLHQKAKEPKGDLANNQDLSDAAREQEGRDQQKCLHSSEWNVAHPLASGSDWYSDAYAAANERTQADETWRDAKAAANSCFEQQGHGTRSEVVQALNDRFVSIAKAAHGETRPSPETIAALEDLISAEEEIDRLAESCFGSHRKLTSELFHRYLNEEVSGSPELQAELMRMQETVDRYRDVLDDLQEQD